MFMVYKMQSLPATHSEMTDVHLKKEIQTQILFICFFNLQY